MIKISKLYITTLLLFIAILCNAQSNVKWSRMMTAPQADFYNITRQVDSAFQVVQVDTGEGSEVEDYIRWKGFWESRMGCTEYGQKNGSFIPALNAIYSSTQTGICTSSFVYPANWTLLGPTSLPYQCMGRIDAVARDPNPSHYSVVYVGAPASGVWRTLDITASTPQWQNITDGLGFPGLGVEDILIQPNNRDVIYIATGFGNGIGNNAGGSYGVQHYYPMPDSNATWIIVQDDGFMGPIYYEYYTDIINKDTLINSKIYTKLYYQHHNYSCAYRSDTLGFTYIAGDSSHEYLIRDFTKNAGDSVKNIFSYTDGYPPSLFVDLYVDSVNYIQAGPYHLKRMFLSNHILFPQPYSVLIWIEKIGSFSNGFYNDINSVGTGSSWLYCMNYNDTTYFNNQSYDDPVYIAGHCDNPTSINNSNQCINSINIYPNPFSDKITIDNLKNSNKYKINIYNSIGELIYEKENIIVDNNSFSLNLCKLSKGIYFITLSYNNYMYSNKIIKE